MRARPCLAKSRGQVVFSKLLSTFKPGSHALPGTGSRRQLVAFANMDGIEIRTRELETPLVGYKVPAPEILAIVDQEREPLYSFSPMRDLVLEMRRPPAHPSIIEYTRPELKLAGVRIDPDGFCRSKQTHYTGLALKPRTHDLTLPFPKVGDDQAKSIQGIPSGFGVRDVSWSPDGKHIAFTCRKVSNAPAETLPPAELWVADVNTCEAKRLLTGINSVFVSYSWIGSDALLAATVPRGLGPSPDEKEKAFGPRCESFVSEDGEKSQTRTYQDLLKDTHDEALFEYYCTSSLVKVEVKSGKTHAFGDTRVYTSTSCSPSGEYILASWIEKPWSYSVPCGRFPKVVQLWDKNGNFVNEIANLPLALNIPLAFDSCRQGPRNISWRDDKPHMVTWAECQDGGDPNAPAFPRDVLYALDASMAGDNTAKPVVLGRTELRFGGMLWCDDSLALMYESEWKTRTSKTWIIAPDGSREPKLLFDLNYEDSYNDPGSPVLRRDTNGSYVIAELDKKRQILLSGGGASPEGSRPFLDILDLDSGEKRRLWRSSPPHFESMSTILSDNVPGVLKLKDLEMLARRETEDTPAQFSIVKFTKDGMLDSEVQISKFPHPYPGLVGMKKDILQYERKDGVKLNGTLYLPPGYDASKDGKLPCILWAYPREFKSRDTAGQLRKSPHQFVSIGSLSPLMLLARGYAVLDGPSFPIFAEGEDEPNDTYVDQLVNSASAAVMALDQTGFIDINRIACGGHSYGAFMAAGLMAHAPHLFTCALCRSGAYNRTLTPFGFQAEERTIWDAPATYAAMAPFMHADKIKKPVLLIHGEADNNPGTFPLQSERMYAALKGHGVTSRLVVLPYESHGYTARESILHTLAEMSEWLDLHN
jgi:dipeptidyl aminopeptidase/acylaminoacyl peptidase